ncbi:MAG: lasso peptide biosynthesis B2 protein [Lachnospiraceae bacterium]|nr:lasso peptide biosynthesis B2 protein [Lachnospiraceae bacterium]
MMISIKKAGRILAACKRWAGKLIRTSAACIRSAGKFIRYPAALKLLCIRVFLLAAYYKLLITFRPFSKIAGRLGQMNLISPEEPVEGGARERVLLVRRAIRAVIPKMHLSNECLVAAFTAKRILVNVPMTVYMGVAKKDGGKMSAHAWTRSGNIFVTGEEGRERFTVTATFA